MNELVSIVVPVYKVEDYLPRCIDSILNQTYHNLEIILVDDGSPDRCGEICDKYAKADIRVKVIHKKNGGLSDARNAGIDIAQGKYISFVDSDDWIHEKYVERLYQLIQETGSDIAVCNFIRTSKEDVQPNIYDGKVYEYSNVEALSQLTDVFYEQMVVAWGKLYKIGILEDVRFPVGRIHEDEFTTYKLIYKAKKIALTREQLLYYWQREDSIMGVGFNVKHKLHVIDAFQERADFLRDIGETELSSKTYRRLFGIYKAVNDQKSPFNSIEEAEKFNRQFNQFKNTLRQSHQRLSFKIYYELYFVLPRAMDLLYRALNSIKKN